MNRKEEISAMIEDYRKNPAKSKADEISIVDAFNDTVYGIDQYFKLLNMHENAEVASVAAAGIKLVREAYSQIERICDVIDTAFGEISLLSVSGNSAFFDANRIVDATIKNKYVVPRGIKEDLVSVEMFTR